MKVELDITTIAQYLRWQMHERNVSTRDLAAEIGCTASTAWRISQGYNFSLRWLIPIAKWCGLAAQDLWNLLDKEGTND